ncbi:MAG: hypothetical protein WA667_29390 [Candidatus Nitrosopolaris sp.]
MNTTTCFRKRNVVVLVTVTVLIVSVGVSASAIVSIQDAQAQTKTNITGSMMGGISSQNKLNMTIGAYGPNITGSVTLAPIIAKAIASRVNVSLVNAAMIAEKAVGANAHAVSVRIGVVHGFLVYIALVVDSNYGFHTVLVDAGNGKVLSSAQMSIAAMMMRARNGMMTGSGTGITFGHPSNTTGVIRGPGMMIGHPSNTTNR